jgi:hypothetical protein
VPSPDDKDYKTKMPSIYYIWHLQININEKVMYKGKIVKNYSWLAAFPLPIIQKEFHGEMDMGSGKEMKL